MKKIIKYFFLVFLLLTGCQKEENYSYNLSEEYKQDVGFIEIDNSKLKELENNQKSFAVFVYMPNCITSANFNTVLNEFLTEFQISFYKISGTEIDNTEIKEKLKYFPTVAIYQEGEIISFLEADKEEHLKYYETKDGFYEWFTKKIILEKPQEEDNFNKTEEDDDSDTLIANNINRYYHEEDITNDTDKLNIYLFWGNGCANCENEFAFLESIYDEYQDKINIYAFEVWYDQENSNLMKEFSDVSGISTKYVPCIIIGDQFFTGYSSENNESILKAIEEEYNQNPRHDYYKEIKNK